MLTLSMCFTIRLPWSHSLKDKRSVRYSLLDSLRQNFQVSVKEVDAQDAHQTLVIGLSYTALDQTEARTMADKFTDFVYDNCQGEVVGIEEDVFSFYS